MLLLSQLLRLQLREVHRLVVSQLEYLSLRENPLSIVPAPVKAVRSLIALDISATYISEFTHDALSGDYKLEKLIARDLDFLWAVEKCAFCGLPNLKEVIFYNCTHLYTVDAEAFGNETTRADNPLKLELLDFERCNISTLSESMVDWSKLTTLKLGYNPFNCDCKLSWLTDDEIDYSAGDAPPRCHTPQRLEGRPLHVLRKRELCNGSFRFGRLFVGLTFVLLASVGLIVGWYVCTSRGRDGNGFRVRNIFYKPQLPRYGYRNLIVKEDEQSLANDDYNDQPDEHSKRKMPPPPVEV
uniref:LRRCT domain-containing protein n=1 Tax=Plectus sambesii TaxID=2011161 RepID=A0A914XGM2_9BILA